MIPAGRILAVAGQFLLVFCVIAICFFTLAADRSSPKAPQGRLRFEVSFPAGLSGTPLDGHVMLGISKEEKPEPRYPVSGSLAARAELPAPIGAYR